MCLLSLLTVAPILCETDEWWKGMSEFEWCMVPILLQLSKSPRSTIYKYHYTRIKLPMTEPFDQATNFTPTHLCATNLQPLTFEIWPKNSCISPPSIDPNLDKTSLCHESYLMLTFDCTCVCLCFLNRLFVSLCMCCLILNLYTHKGIETQIPCQSQS